jgi:anti-sigma-K factor RskA
MSACDHVRTDLGGYVLGALDPAEADAVREHLGRCSECAREHASLADLPALLTLAEPIESAEPLAPAVEERVLDAVARERVPREPRPQRRPLLRRPRLLIPAFAAVAAVAVALVLALGGEHEPYQVALKPVAGSTAAGRTQLVSTAGGTKLQMWVRGLPADPNVVYEVHCDAPDWSASAGTFRVDANGRAHVFLTTAARRGQYDSIRVVRRSSDTNVLTATLN